MIKIYTTDNYNVCIGEDVYPTGDLVANYEGETVNLISLAKGASAFCANYKNLCTKENNEFQSFADFQRYIDAILSTNVYQKQTKNELQNVSLSASNVTLLNGILQELKIQTELLRKIYL